MKPTENPEGHQKLEAVFKNLPQKSYDIIYADPPWKYSFSRSSSRKIENHYPTMKLTDIKSLADSLPCEKNCLLYLWVTAPKLIEGLEVMDSWGFKYKSHAIWDKCRIGMGYWFRGQHELILTGTKGTFSPPLPKNRIPSIFKEKRKSHSTKPNCFQEWIENTFPESKKLELFAREKKQGWDSWGNEI